MSEQDKKLIKFVTAVTQRLEQLSDKIEQIEDVLAGFSDRLKDVEDYMDPDRCIHDPEEENGPVRL